MSLLNVVVGLLVLAALVVAGLVALGQAIMRRSHTGRISVRTAALLRAVVWTTFPVLAYFAFPGSLPASLVLMVSVGTFALSAFLGLRRAAKYSPTDERTV
jgi:hypothetical protein